MVNNVETIKKIIKKLHDGAEPKEVQSEYSEFLEEISTADISRAEEELIREGMPVEKVRKLCDVHIAVFQSQLEKNNDITPQGHPVNILMSEHNALLSISKEVYTLAKAIREPEHVSDENLAQLKHLVQQIKDSANHYLREENVLFPHLEKHGVTQPPAIMWMEHDQIRELEKNLFDIFGGTDKDILSQIATVEHLALSLNELLASHFYKENNILFPTALRVISEDEWPEVMHGFKNIGFCPFTPEFPDIFGHDEITTEAVETPKGLIRFDTGELSIEMLEGIFNTLPVDITFVDADDKVRFFSESGGRIFVRSKAVIGRSVQLCHPQKSIDIVNKILDDFRNNHRDSADFWIKMRERVIYIRYFAVRNREGKYLGTLEVTQDITEIQKLEGEKRLLDDPQ